MSYFSDSLLPNSCTTSTLHYVLCNYELFQWLSYRHPPTATLHPHCIMCYVTISYFSDSLLQTSPNSYTTSTLHHVLCNYQLFQWLSLSYRLPPTATLHPHCITCYVTMSYFSDSLLQTSPNSCTTSTLHHVLCNYQLFQWLSYQLQTSPNSCTTSTLHHVLCNYQLFPWLSLTDIPQQLHYIHIASRAM